MKIDLRLSGKSNRIQPPHRAVRPIINAFAFSLCVLGTGACGVGSPEVSNTNVLPNNDAPAASTNLTTVGDSADGKAVSIAWKEVMGGAAKSADSPLVAEITNHSDEPLSGRIILSGVGLDGRKVTRQMGTFSLDATAKSTVSVPVSSLPVQSELSASLATLEVEIDGPQGTVRARTRNLYHVFSGGFAKAELYSTEELRKLPNGGLRTTDRLDVRGRVWDSASKAMVDGAAPADTGRARLGLSGPSRAEHGGTVGPHERASACSTKATVPTPAAVAKDATCVPNSSFSCVQVCLRWNVWYSDSGFGEDVWTTQGWDFVEASYAWAALSINGQRFWEANVDKYGCTPYLSLPKSTPVTAEWWTNWQWDAARNIEFNILQSSDNTENGVLYPTVVSESFTTPASGTQTVVLQSAYNDDAIQVAAVSGLMLRNNDDRATLSAFDYEPLTLAQNRTIRMLVDVGVMLDGVWRTDYATTDKIGSTAGGNNEPGAWWKFLIAHEFGHSFGTGLGMYGVAAPTDSHPRCTCSVVTNAPDHCLHQSHGLNYASNEGMAHAFAARLFNYDLDANGKFVYYKKQLSSNGWTIHYPPRAYDAYEPVRWLERYCDRGWTDRGTEGDYLTFLYNVTQRDRANRTTVWDLDYIGYFACGGIPGCSPSRWSTAPSAGDTYAQSILSAAAFRFGSTSDPRYVRFQQTGVNHGIAHN